mmetsp:Transcript_17707/g.25549  ORF Transcript_17707/g.25549 Transcript_17707/m.25549 type:complete len:97 (+) Transcript_17707:410-700(+)
MQRYFGIVIEQTIWTAAIFQINSIFGSGGCVSSYIISIFRRNKVTTEASTCRQEVEESSLSLQFSLRSRGGSNRKENRKDNEDSSTSCRLVNDAEL